MSKKVIATKNAPSAIGTYSQAIQSGSLLFISGQIPLNPNTMAIVNDSFDDAAHCVFKNLAAIADAAGSSLNNAVKINISLTDLTNFTVVNEVMAQYFDPPYPARAVVEVAALPKDVPIEIEAIIDLDN